MELEDQELDRPGDGVSTGLMAAPLAAIKLPGRQRDSFARGE